MTPDQYRSHKSGALRRAFFRGGDAFRAGAELADNPYRSVQVIRRALDSRSWWLACLPKTLEHLVKGGHPAMWGTT